MQKGGNLCQIFVENIVFLGLERGWGEGFFPWGIGWGRGVLAVECKQNDDSGYFQRWLNIDLVIVVNYSLRLRGIIDYQKKKRAKVFFGEENVPNSKRWLNIDSNLRKCIIISVGTHELLIRKKISPSHDLYRKRGETFFGDSKIYATIFTTSTQIS